MKFTGSEWMLAGAVARLALGAALLAPAAALPAAVDARLASLERAVSGNPEDLRACAEYRQRVIAARDFDRSIKLLEQLAARPRSGPNVHLSLALAYVDKVPVASPFRRIFLGRDAMREVTLAIEREPSAVAYYMRGVVALYYPEAVFHKTRGGIADLERSLAIVLKQSPQPSDAKVYTSLGDGYWKVHELSRAISIWTDGLRRYPASSDLLARLAVKGAELDRLIEHVLDPATRVDTSLQELFGPLPGI
jgi:tetratricopeptide (TPR) repeat protein